MTARRLLFVAYGSAGDLFPTIPIMSRLLADGDEVLCALPRPLSMHLRAIGIPTHGLGRGAEMALADSSDALSARLGGWASVRSLALHYLDSTLDNDVAALDDLISSWQPDAVVATTLAGSARVAAHRRGCPVVHLGMYPQILTQLAGVEGFARAYRRRCTELARLPDASGPPGDELAWGIATGRMLMHDPAFLGLVDGRELRRILDPPCHPDVIGFPYWDDALYSEAMLDEVRSWIASSPDPVVLVTMGSFLGASRAAQWQAVQPSLTSCGLRALLLVSRRDARSLENAGPGTKVVAGYVPLSKLLDGVACAVHHGGLGTTFATLRAGVPSVVTPMAFDQPFNARLLEACAVGHTTTPAEAGQGVARVMGDRVYSDRAQQVASHLTSSEAAVDRAVQRIRAGA